MLTQLLVSSYKINQNYFIYFDFLRDILLFFQIFSILFIFLISRNYKMIFIYLASFIFILLITHFLQIIIPSPRPLTYYFHQSYLSNSFPSNHTTLSTFSTFFIFKNNFPLGIFSLIITLLIALFSYFSLMHWLIDILAGFLLGILMYFLIRKILHSFFRFDI